MNSINDDWKITFFKNYFKKELSSDNIRKWSLFKNSHMGPLFQYTKVKHAEDLINSDLMFMRKINELNDPLEGDLKCDFEKMIDIKLDESFDGLDDSDKEFIKADYRNKLIKNFVEGWENIKDKISIACFSEKCDISPMWAHYADNHQGICVEYNFHENGYMRDICFPVYYLAPAKNKIICDKIIKEGFAQNRLTSQLFLKKGTDWNYEKEWRIIIPDNLHVDGINFSWRDKKRYLKFIKPKSVYLGCNIEKDDEKYVKTMCKDFEIKVYKMVKNNSGYNLKRELIS